MDESVSKLNELQDSGFADPEGWYIYALLLARAGAATHALDFLARSVDGGYCSYDRVDQSTRVVAAGRTSRRSTVLVERTAGMLANARARFESAHGADVLSTRDSPSSKG